jgi:hypothetical protein
MGNLSQSLVARSICCSAIDAFAKVHWTNARAIAHIDFANGGHCCCSKEGSKENAMPSFEIYYREQDGRLVEKFSVRCASPLKAKIMAHAMKIQRSSMSGRSAMHPRSMATVPPDTSAGCKKPKRAARNFRILSPY